MPLDKHPTARRWHLKTKVLGSSPAACNSSPSAAGEVTAAKVLLPLFTRGCCFSRPFVLSDHSVLLSMPSYRCRFNLAALITPCYHLCRAMRSAAQSPHVRAYLRLKLHKATKTARCDRRLLRWSAFYSTLKVYEVFGFFSGFRQTSCHATKKKLRASLSQEDSRGSDVANT